MKSAMAAGGVKKSVQRLVLSVFRLGAWWPRSAGGVVASASRKD